MDLGLRDRACIVTGASRGIGQATAAMLAGEGASVLLIGRDADALDEVATACAARGGRASALALDVTAVDAGEVALSGCLEAFGRVDALINNAGTSRAAALEDLTEEDWQSQWELNVLAPMRLMRACAPAMAERGWGRIVSVSSSSGKRPGQRNVAYSVAKAAQLSLSRAYADAYAAKGVLINAITPGPVGTGLWLAPHGLAEQVAAAQGVAAEQVLAQTARGVPLGRFGTPSEIASVITFLCSEQASNVAGVAWSVDGGLVPVII
jgi:3-oxoacyl-[acyl-carrier protein] reductase